MEINSMSEALQLHAQILKSSNNYKTNNDLTNLFTFTALSPAGDLSHARRLLSALPSPSSFHFNTMLRAYAHSPNPIDALRFFTASAQTPDNFTFPFLFKSCARLKLLFAGKQLHATAVKLGLCTDRFVCHSLIHFYSKCGDSSSALELFDRMSERDVVSWTAMIGGLVDDGRAAEAIRLFREMSAEVVNEVTVVAVSKACAETGALGVGNRVHEMVRELGIGLRGNVGTALIDMYAKCGCVESARRVFEEVKMGRDVFAWTAMMSGFASHGRCGEAITLFEEMRQLGMRPDKKTMTAVLCACRNSGRVDEAWGYLMGMEEEFGVGPTVQHYGCVVDLLARDGRLGEAEELITKMPMEPDAIMWRTLIWACKAHNDIARAERLVGHISGGDAGSLILVGNVYASSGKWEHKAKARESMSRRGLAKPPGSSKIELDWEIHEFVVGDSSHPESEKIYKKSDEIEKNLREKFGYQPKISEVLLEIGDEEKASQLRHHSEKLALAFGLIKTSPGQDIRIVKNLRSCEDCHGFMKAVSRVYRREIVVRDRIRFHHFSNGNCSCQDNW